MTVSDWAALTSIVVAIGGITIMGIKWTIKHYLAELKPNGGSSLNDVIKLQLLPLVQELRSDQIEIKKDVAKLEGRFEQHIDESPEW
jgi:hypothetical protein